MGIKIGVLIPAERLASVMSPEDRQRLSGLGEVVWNDHAEHLSPPNAEAMLADCDVAIGSWGTVSPANIHLPQCPRLRLWVHAAGSVKHMFGEHLRGCSLVIASCAPAIAQCVAEMTIGQLIVGLKRVGDNAAGNRREVRYPKRVNSMTLGDARIGVLGASQVGRRVIAHLVHFGCRPLVYDPYLTSGQASAMGATKVDDLTDLCRQAHAITLHTPLTPATRHLIGPAQLAVMRDDAVIVNTARGGCIDEPALTAELAKGRFLAMLDVSDPEPAAVDSPLRSLPNVVYTSHIAGGANWRIGRQAVDDVEAFLADRVPQMVVTADMLDRLA